jgi:periplasmic protein TonB
LGAGLATDFDVLHIEIMGPEVPRLPGPRWTVAGSQLAASATLHAIAVLALMFFSQHFAAPSPISAPAATASAPVDVRHIVFIAREAFAGGGGGGGGNRQSEPIRHAQGVGSDAMTLRARKSTPSPSPTSTTGRLVDVSPPAAMLLLDAKPLASGTIEQIGLPLGGVSSGTSTGSGSGGGVGEGIGTGIGSGRGSGIGPGSGGGIGGGAYRPGGAVTFPRVVTEIKPKYTGDALLRKIQGTVVVELVVKADGRPSDIRVVRSLDPEGLDREAVLAASQWRFEPGRLAGAPVDVLVTIWLDFWIR